MIGYYFKLFQIIIVTTYYSSVAILNNLFGNQDSFYKLAKKWSSLLVKIIGIEIEIDQESNLKSRNYLIVANHCSFLDIPVILSSIDIKIGILYKKELEKVPLFGFSLRKSPFPAVDRKNLNSSIKTIFGLTKHVSSEVSILVFPEGTRSEDGELQDFKNGAFIVAKKTGLPILPITIIGTHQLMPKNSKVFTSGKVTLMISQEIAVNNYSIKDLSKQTRLVIENNLKNCKK